MVCKPMALLHGLRRLQPQHLCKGGDVGDVTLLNDIIYEAPKVSANKLIILQFPFN